MNEPLPLNTAPLPVKLRLEDYLMLDDAGAFADYRKTELIEGELYFMNAQHRPHARTKSRLHVLLAAALDAHGHDWEAIVEGSIAIPPHSSPEPDIVVTSEAEGTGLIPLDTVKLIVEVSDTTLAFDTERKAALYARAGVPEYWVADVNAKTVHQMWSSTGDDYAERREVTFGEQLVAKTIEKFAVETSGL